MLNLTAFRRIVWHLPYWFIILGMGVAYFLKQPPAQTGYFADLNLCLTSGITAIQATSRDINFDNEMCLVGYKNPMNDHWDSTRRAILTCFDGFDVLLDDDEAEVRTPYDPGRGWPGTSKSFKIQDKEMWARLFAETRNCLKPYISGDPDAWQSLERLLSITPEFFDAKRMSLSERQVYSNILKMKYSLARWICLQNIAHHVGCCNITVNDWQLLLVPPPENPRVGTKYGIRIFLANARLKQEDLSFYADNQRLPAQLEGSLFTFIPTQAGKQKIRFRANIREPVSGKTQEWFRDFEFDVAK